LELGLRQERDELAAMPLVKLRRVAGELIFHFVPRVIGTAAGERLTVMLHSGVCAER
jgi:hypothetical protein